ncbi:MAG TPA: NAD(P)/FAD-dependent oxidoreductase [Candidatus Krumholzibacteria bacterium]|mgnify:CR=1 FL=1|nr:NAD(P)/FAD-dependent oxidoreductase [Candidatus Krumholzibacteria bacterium]HRX52179.1 NAD(P)/FAD-dependent oxidoreductase [Candidatus Krumholzibacteria bacterium]
MSADATGRRPRVVIVGGGFGGLNAAKSLADAPVDIALFDRHNYHLFQPLLYQVASAVLSPADVAEPIRRILSRQRNCRVLLNEVRRIDPERRLVLHADGATPYDFLILAAGATHSYFGHEEWERHAPGLKTVDDALEIRRRVLMAFEEAEQEADAEARRAKLTFVVVGAGPTGVELAGALKEIATRTVPADFRNIDTTTARVLLLEGAPRVLPAMPEQLSDRARRDLESLGVEVRTETMVTGVDADGVSVGEESLAAANVLWAAGVQASPLARDLGGDLDKRGRVIVAPDLSVPDRPELFVVGDLAHVPDPRYPDGVPGMAQGAIQGGRHAAKVIRGLVRGDGNARPAFRYRDRGSLATIGRNHAVADLGRWRFGGWFAWLLWGAVHVASLVGFRARGAVLWNWVWNYLRHDKGARLITGSPRPRMRQARSGFEAADSVSSDTGSASAHDRGL